MFLLIFLTKIKKKKERNKKYEYKNQRELLQLIDTISGLFLSAFENFFIEKTKIYCISANTSGTYTKSHFQDLKLR